jgi:Protein of unknown function (DUF3592)
MALSAAIINEIKGLIREHKTPEAESVLITAAGLSPAEAKVYIDRLTKALPSDAEEIVIPQGTRKAAFVIVGIGILLFGLAAYFFIEKTNQMANSHLITGIVVGFIVDDGAAPIIDYEIEGVFYQYTSNVYASPPGYEINETVEIYVNNDDPNDIIINSFGNKWLAVTILGIFGSVMVLIGLLLFKVALTKSSGNIDFFDTQTNSLNPLDD